MTSFPLSEAEAQFTRLVEAAKQATVTLTENGKPAVVMEPAMLSARRKSRGWTQLEAVMDEVGEYAATQGLTDEMLRQLLADES